MKYCSKCKTEKEVSEFGKKQSQPDGLSRWCKDCKSKADKLNYENNKEKRLNRAKRYYEQNKEKILTNLETKKRKSEYQKKLQKENPEVIRKYKKTYREKNPDKIKEYRKEYHSKEGNSHWECRKNYYVNNPLGKVVDSVRKRLWELINTKGYDKKYKFEEYIGCTKEELEKHIESQFTEGMTWDNHGEWHVDHILPLSLTENEQQIYELCHYKNLRPMWGRQNESKNNKADICWQKLQRDRFLQEDIDNGFPTNLKISDFNLSYEKITNEHRKFIERYEWLKTTGYGVRYVFTARWNNKLAGVVMIAEPNQTQFGKKEALIQRGACASWTPVNLGSKLIMFACRWMVANTDKRYFTAYSDPSAGEIGTIYQACNFDYLGADYGASSVYKYNGKLVSGLLFNRTSFYKKIAKENNIEWRPEYTKENGYKDMNKIPQELKNLVKKIRNECPKIKVKPKGKYVLLLNYGKEKLIKTWVSKPYPKRAK